METYNIVKYTNTPLIIEQLFLNLQIAQLTSSLFIQNALRACWHGDDVDAVGAWLVKMSCMRKSGQ